MHREVAHRGCGAEARAGRAPLGPALLEVAKGTGKAQGPASAASGGAGSGQGGSTKLRDMKDSPGLDESGTWGWPRARFSTRHLAL